MMLQSFSAASFISTGLDTIDVGHKQLQKRPTLSPRQQYISNEVGGDGSNKHNVHVESLAMSSAEAMENDQVVSNFQPQGKESQDQCRA